MIASIIFIAGCTSTQQNQQASAQGCQNCDDNNTCTFDTCDYSINQCKNEPVTYTCCGNGKCDVGENCKACGTDCGSCSPVTSNLDAIDKVSRDSRVAQSIEQNTKFYNCPSKHLEVRNSVVEMSRVTFSQNLIACSVYDSNTLEKMKTILSSDLFSKLESCDKSLIEDYNKVLRGYSVSSMALSETCFDCDEIYAIHMGCVDSENNRGYSAFAILDVKTGVVYW